MSTSLQRVYNRSQLESLKFFNKHQSDLKPIFANPLRLQHQPFSLLRNRFPSLLRPQGHYQEPLAAFLAFSHLRGMKHRSLNFARLPGGGLQIVFKTPLRFCKLTKKDRCCKHATNPAMQSSPWPLAHLPCTHPCTPPALTSPSCSPPAAALSDSGPQKARASAPAPEPLAQPRPAGVSLQSIPDQWAGASG